MYTTLISAPELQAQLNTSKPTFNWVIIDCRSDLMRPTAGYEAYLAGHIPDAVYANLETDLSAPKSATTGRHPLPKSAALLATFSRWGINSNTQVIAYDADNAMYASRLWWLLRWMGHTAVAVLDGGIKAWQQKGFPLTNEVPLPLPGNFVGTPHNDFLVTTELVADYAQRSDWRILDARAPERFRGEVEPIDPVAGHIPGASNHPFAWNLGAESRLLPAATLAQKFQSSLSGIAPDHSIMMCGSGVTACHNLLAMEIAGLHGAKLYAGSWSEWIRDPSRPIA